MEHWYYQWLLIWVCQVMGLKKEQWKKPCLCNTFTMHSLGACAAHESININ